MKVKALVIEDPDNLVTCEYQFIIIGDTEYQQHMNRASHWSPHKQNKDCFDPRPATITIELSDDKDPDLRIATDGSVSILEPTWTTEENCYAELLYRDLGPYQVE